MGFSVIDKDGERPVCGRCYSARKPITRGSTCDDCRQVDREARAFTRRRLEEMRAFMAEWHRQNGGAA